MTNDTSARHADRATTTRLAGQLLNLVAGWLEMTTLTTGESVEVRHFDSETGQIRIEVRADDGPLAAFVWTLDDDPDFKAGEHQ